MSTKLQNIRETVQIRASKDWHEVIKIEAAKRNITMSRLLDKIFESYYGSGAQDLHNDQ